MFYKNARIFCPDFRFHIGAFEVKDGRFGAVLPADVPEDAVDLKGATVIPGLVDAHIHGAAGADFSDGDYEGLKAMAKYFAQCGATSFAPASMTLPYDVLSKAFTTAKQLKEEAPEGHSRIMGIQMEGPYFSYAKRGAQNADYLKNPDFDGFKKLYDDCDGLIRIVDIAPELPGAAEFVAKAKALCTVSIAHTDSDYDHARAAVDAGVTHLTAKAGDCRDESTIRKVETFNNDYRMKEKGAVLNWFDITEPEGFLSLNSKLAEVMASPQGNAFFFGLINKMMPPSEEGGMKVDASMFDIMSSFTMLRLINMAGGTLNIQFSKEDLLALNAQLNQIPKA